MSDLNNCGLIFGIKYLGNDSILDKFKGKKNISAALAFGANAQQLSKRKEIIKIIKKNRINTPNIISPKASIEKYASMKEGNIIFDGSIIDFSVSLGNFQRKKENIKNTPYTTHAYKIGTMYSLPQ